MNTTGNIKNYTVFYNLRGYYSYIITLHLDTEQFYNKFTNTLSGLLEDDFKEFCITKPLFGFCSSSGVSV